jgi:hypothetical protein
MKETAFPANLRQPGNLGMHPLFRGFRATTSSGRLPGLFPRHSRESRHVLKNKGAATR